MRVRFPNFIVAIEVFDQKRVSFGFEKYTYLQMNVQKISIIENKNL